ncbi:MAG TPA: NAD(P)H-dependent oxidoreductase [Caulobacteraceae bacterium]|jgi:FMN-dependent NADH-azoreductase|nr:NAD(P)H-dependent oxidoreductase [Caulobacteraceae bacterium]
MKLLHVDASVLGSNSVSRQVSAAAVERLKAQTPGLEVIRRDLAIQPLPHLTGEHLARAESVQDELAAGQAALDEFLAADIVVIGAPMYNFTIPTQLKAWIDRILIAGKTFRYGAAGPEGLAGDKRVIIAISRGNFYGPGAPAEAAEHLETYLRTVFGFIGVTNVEFIVAEGVQAGPEHRVKAIEGALERATHLEAA